MTDIEDRASRILGSVDVSDRVGRLLGIIASITAAVDISDRPARFVGQVSSVAGSLWDVSDRAARLLGLVAEMRAATLGVTAVSAVNVGLTLTLPAPGAGLFHYIVSLELVKLYNVVGVAAGAGVTITSTNMPGNPAWTTEQLASPAGTATKVIVERPTTPWKSSAANTATTFVAPAQLQTIWRWNVRYFTGA